MPLRPLSALGYSEIPSLEVLSKLSMASAMRHGSTAPVSPAASTISMQHLDSSGRAVQLSKGHCECGTRRNRLAHGIEEGGRGAALNPYLVRGSNQRRGGQASCIAFLLLPRTRVYARLNAAPNGPPHQTQYILTTPPHTSVKDRNTSPPFSLIFLTWQAGRPWANV